MSQYLDEEGSMYIKLAKEKYPNCNEETLCNLLLEKQELTKNLKSVRKNLQLATKPKEKGRAPIELSDALCDYLGVHHGFIVDRPKMTSMMSVKIREQQPEDKPQGVQFQFFVYDPKLKAILGEPRLPVRKPTESDPNPELGYTYSNLPRYLADHFRKVDKSTPMSVIPKELQKTVTQKLPKILRPDSDVKKPVRKSKTKSKIVKAMPEEMELESEGISVS